MQRSEKGSCLMKAADTLLIEDADWVARDILELELTEKLLVISVHDRVINLKIEGCPKLFMLAHPDLPRGPACVGLSGRLFDLCHKLLPRGSCAHFEPGSLYLAEGRLAVSWRACETLSFAAPEHLQSNRAGIRAALKKYRQLLARTDAHSASAVLLGLNGPDPYFQDKIIDAFPLLVRALVTNNQQGFKYSCRNLIGMGRGATPSGDDLIFGALIAAHYYARVDGAAVKVPSCSGAITAKTTIMGAHMLELGQMGLAPEQVIRFILSIFDATARAELLHDLLLIGSATGYDIAAAVLFTLDKLSAAEELYEDK